MFNPQQGLTTEISFVTSPSLPMFLWRSSRQSARSRLWLTCSQSHLWDQLLGGISALWRAGAASAQLLLSSEVSRSWVSATRGSSESSRVSQPLLRWDCSWRCKSGAPACYQRQDFSCMKGRNSSSPCPALLGTSWAVPTPTAFHCLPVMFIAGSTLCSTLCYLCQTPLSINHLVQAKGKPLKASHVPWTLLAREETE